MTKMAKRHIARKTSEARVLSWEDDMRNRFAHGFALTVDF
jgi:hypothetical protein